LICGCALVTSKPKKIELTYGYGYEDRDITDERESMKIGPTVSFDNGHKMKFTYRYRSIENIKFTDIDVDENGVFFEYTHPIWVADKDAGWGKGKWINPFK
jgi:hypothetical protein